MAKAECPKCGTVEIDKSQIRAKGSPNNRSWEVDCPKCGKIIIFLVGKGIK